MHPDSLAHDSVVVDTSQLYHAPLYPDSFPSLPAADSVSRPLNSLGTLKPVVGEPATPLGHSLIHDTGAMALLLSALFFLIVSYRTGYKYLEGLAHNMFSVRLRESLFEDYTVKETQILSALIFLTCTLEGLLVYQGLTLWHPSLCELLQRSTSWYVLLFVGLCLVYYLAQLVLFNLLGYVFSDKESTRVWLDGFKSSQSLLGLLLFPVVCVSLAVPSLCEFMLISAIILYICTRIIFICKGFRIFYSNLLSFLYFILYLCSVEIVPLIAIYGITISLCTHITF